LISVLPKSFFTNEIIYEEIVFFPPYLTLLEFNINLYIKLNSIFLKQNKTKDGEKILKAGTLEAIIVSFTQFESTDVKHLKEFLLTYR